METKQANGVQVQNGAPKENTNKAAQNGMGNHENGNQPKKELANGKPGAEKAAAQTPEMEKPKPEEPKFTQQPKEEVSAKAVLNLEGKLKVVETLHRKSVQRINLISRIKQLEVFEVNLATENDELEENVYQGCKLIIEDDKQRRFITTTPGLIRLVSQFIFNACHEKLAEIEANIVFPGV